MAEQYTKDATRVAAGLKAAMHNPNVSEGAKDQASERLSHMGQQEVGTGRSSGAEASGMDSNRVLGGYKATLQNTHTSEQAKEHAREVLEAAGYHYDRPAGSSEEEHNTRVLAGYKAALNNPRVSEEAKKHAREYLEANGAL